MEQIFDDCSIKECLFLLYIIFVFGKWCKLTIKNAKYVEVFDLLS